MSDLETTILSLFLVFVRTGTCLMLLPGFSAVNVPMRVRLYAALGITFAIFSIVTEPRAISETLYPSTLAKFIFAEFMVGAIIALPVRLFVLGVLFMGEATTQMVGLNPIPGAAVGEDQVSTTLGTMFSVSLVTLFFATGVHLNFFVVLLNSYMVYPQAEFLDATNMLDEVTRNLSRTFLLVIQFSAPIVIVALVMNLIAGLVNKLTPQIPIYFVSAPFLIAVCLAVMAWVADDILGFLNLELARIVSQLLR